MAERIEELAAIHPALFDYAVNLYLVAHRARRACLLESAQLEVTQQELIEEALAYAKELGLVVYLQHQEFPRYLVVRPEDQAQLDGFGKAREPQRFLAELLEFQCVDHRFANQDIPRLAKHLSVTYADRYSMQVVEVCEAERGPNRESMVADLETKAARYRRVLPAAAYRVEWRVEEITPVYVRYERLADLDYVQTHMGDYLNDLYNAPLDLDTSLLVASFEDMSHHAARLEVYRFLWVHLVMEDDVGTVQAQQGASYTGIEQAMATFDRQVAEEIDTIKWPRMYALWRQALTHMVSGLR